MSLWLILLIVFASIEAKKEKPTKAKSTAAKDDPPSLIFNSEDITEFQDPQDFVKVVLKSTRIWVVIFTADDPLLASSIPECVKAASHLKGEINFAAVDCRGAAGALCSHFAKELGEKLPKLLLFKSELERIKEGTEGKDAFSKKPVIYEGKISAASIARWAVTYLDNIVPFIDTQAAYDRYIETTKQLNYTAVFSSKASKVPRLISSLALNFKFSPFNEAFLPIAQLTADLSTSKHNIVTFPTLSVIKSDGTLIHYEGDLQIDPMTSFLNGFTNDRDAFEQMAQKAQKQQPPKKKKTEPVKRELQVIDSKEAYERACGPRGVCFLSFLDPSDPDNAQYVTKLATLASQHQAAIGWVNGPEQPAMVKGFSLADGFPQMIALWRSKQQMRTFKGGFDLDQLTEFVKETLHSRKRVATLDKVPEFIQPVKPEL